MAQTGGGGAVIDYDSVVSALGYVPAASDGNVFEITAEDISTALTFIPYNAANPAGYITNNDISGLASKSYVDGSIALINNSINQINSNLNVIDSSLGALDASVAALHGMGKIVYVDELTTEQKKALCTKLINSYNDESSSTYDVPVMYIYKRLVYCWQYKTATTIYLHAIDGDLHDVTGGDAMVNTGYVYSLNSSSGNLTQVKTYAFGSGSGNYDTSIAALDSSIRYLDTSLNNLRGWVSRNDASLTAVSTTVSLHDTSITNLDSSVSAISQWITTAGTPSVNILNMSAADASALYNEMVTAAVNNTYYDKIIYIGDKYVYEWKYVPQSESNWMPDETYSSAVAHIVLNTLADYNNRVRRETFK